MDTRLEWRMDASADLVLMAFTSSVLIRSPLEVIIEDYQPQVFGLVNQGHPFGGISWGEK